MSGSQSVSARANPTRRLTFAKTERAKALALATAAAETRNAFAEYLDSVLKARGCETVDATWNYDPLTGVAVRVQ